MNHSSGNEIVDTVGQFHFRGNIIHESWYHHIKMDNGKTDALGLLLLAEIVFFYRPQMNKDETTGNVRYTKRFKSDLLQKSYGELSERFGFTKRQVRDALSRLEKLGVITKHFRHFTTADHIKLSNVLFIELHPVKLHEITFGSGGYDVITSHGLQNKVTAPNKESDTNTQSTLRIKEKEKAASLVNNEKPKREVKTGDLSSIYPPKERMESQQRLSAKYQELFGVANSTVNRNIVDTLDFFSEEVILEAFDRMKANAQKPSWNYLNGIFKKWRQAGVKTLEDVKALEQKETVPPKTKESTTTKLAAMLEKLKQEGRV